jgi:FkbH-like protein
MLKELLYPFDANYILLKKKQLKRQLLETSDGFINKKIAILGGSTTNDIKLILELFLLNYGIRPSFYESEYNQYYQDAVFANSKLELFAPDIIYIHTTNRNITQFPSLSDDVEAINWLITQEMDKYQHIWNHLRETYGCPIIQNNFEMPFYRLMGNKDASDIHGKVNFLTHLNMEFNSYAQTHEDFYICDINYISADYGLREWSNPFYFYMYKYALNVNAIPYLSFNVANIIKSVFGKNKKGFVLDLDNTLWGGVIGDDGVENIVLGPEDAEGQVYSEFQHYIKEHQQLGIILNIDSKNDYKNAIAGLKHPDSKLSEDDFIEIKANWNPKDQNFLDISKELNLLPESLVFVDDNPAERHIVTEQLPGVCAPEIGPVYNYIQNIDRNGFFEVTTISKDDVNRNKMYRENIERIKSQANFTNYREYLLSLSMQGIIKAFEPIYYARIAQLTNKSNQFNLTTRRYTQTEIENIATDDDFITLYGKLIDKFGDNGIVSAIVGHKFGVECQIDLWIMSCRVLKRNMEYAMMDALVEQCRMAGIHQIRGYYYPTAKNHMVRDFYSFQGFSKTSEDSEGNTEWIFEIPTEYKHKNKVIKMEG